jgi:hypothetical protein
VGIRFALVPISIVMTRHTPITQRSKTYFQEAVWRRLRMQDVSDFIEISVQLPSEVSLGNHSRHPLASAPANFPPWKTVHQIGDRQWYSQN